LLFPLIICIPKNTFNHMDAIYGKWLDDMLTGMVSRAILYSTLL